MINTFDTHTILHNLEREWGGGAGGGGGGGRDRQTDGSEQTSGEGTEAAKVWTEPVASTQTWFIQRHPTAPYTCLTIPAGVSLAAPSAPPFLQHYPPLSALLLQVHARPSNNRRSALGLCSQHLITRVGRTIVLPIKPIYNRNSAPALLFSFHAVAGVGN